MRKVVLSAVFLVLCVPGMLAQRLPAGAIPEHYQLTFNPDFNTDTFTGEEIIDLKLTKPSASITLNVAEIKFVSVSAEVNKVSIPGKAYFDSEREQATIRLERPLPAGPVRLQISFTGLLNDKLRGFYVSKTPRRKYAITQFEPTDARRAFPSFDEPDKKATFDIAVIADKGDTAIGNSKLVSDTPGPGDSKHTLKFATTARISTYLVAVLVGDFQCLEGSADGIPIRACAVPEKKELGSFALHAAENFMRWYDNYFAMKYPWDKLDMIAIPDFEAGAMENVAAITYRESAMLIDEKHASLAVQKNVAVDIAHNMAHQWFGDLVTMKWWDHLWLSEGLATWMETKPVAAWRPEWNMPLSDVAAIDQALKLDSLQSTRAIRARAETYDEINEQFDGIAYGKAAAVLRMVESYVTPEVFRRGINNYLKAHVLGNATAEDFWGALTTVSSKPVNKVMLSLVAQPGAPLISASKQGGDASLLQERLFADRRLLGSALGQVWTIPVCVRLLSAGSRTAGGTPTEDRSHPSKTANSRCVLFQGKQQTVPLEGAGGVIFLNAGGSGYYRSDYDPASRKEIAAAAGQALSPAERISLVGDEWALAGVGRESIGDYMDLVEALKSDREPAVLEQILLTLEYIADYLVADFEQPSFQAWLRSFLQPTLSDLEKPNGLRTDEDRELLASIFSLLGSRGEDPQIIAKARQITMRYAQDPSSVDGNLAEEALKVSARHGDAALFNQFGEKLKQAKTPEEHNRYLSALSSFTDPVLVRRALELGVSGQVRNQDSAFFVSAIMQEKAGRKIAWDFVRSHWNQVLARTTTGTGYALFNGAATFCDAEAAQQVKQFFTVNKVAATDRTLKQTLEKISGCADFRALQQPNLSSWLSDHTEPRPAGGN